MFWSKETVGRKEFQELFAKFENLRIEVESVKIELKLYQNKLARKAGIKLKEDEEEQKPEDPFKSMLIPVK